VIERFGLITSDIFPDYTSCISDECYYWFSCYWDDSFPVYTLDTVLGCYDKTLSVRTLNADIRLAISPNPASAYALINYDFTDRAGNEPILEICNALGQTVYTQPLPMYSGLQKIDVSDFAAGTYTVFIKRQNGVVAMTKLVVGR
jgi:hypothetical protein